LGVLTAVNKLILIEIAGFLGAVLLGMVWFIKPDGNLEPLVALFSLVGVAVEIVRRLTKKTLRGRFESNGERIQHRELLAAVKSRGKMAN
jgi:hypothetical protein